MLVPHKGDGAWGMFAVEVYASVRQFVFVEGHSKREAARVFGLARETVDEDVPVLGAAGLPADEATGEAQARPVP